jgi:choloylglycine hydrolase
MHSIRGNAFEQENKLTSLTRLLWLKICGDPTMKPLSKIQKIRAKLGFILYLLAIGQIGSAKMMGCTGISLTTTEGHSIHARTIEWASSPLLSELVVAPRNLECVSLLPKETSGIRWTNRYGYVGLSLIESRIIGEGMNEKGLNAGLFYFPHYGSLAPFDAENTRNRIADVDLVRWFLGSFATVTEVREALSGVTVAPADLDDEGRPLPTAHWRVTDAEGGSIVIEIIENGQVHVYDNTVGVLTNSPGFPWHVTNLNTLINVRPGTEPPRMLDDHRIFSLGAGTRAIGLPGDFSPSSRFLRAAFFRSSAPPTETTLEAVSQAFTILSNFNIPIGTAFAPEDREHLPKMPSATHWTAVSDPTAMKFYYRTMFDGRIQSVDLNRIDFESDDLRTYSIGPKHFMVDDATPP